MSLIVEDGTGIEGAESYISVSDATTYHAARGNDSWAALTPQRQEQALRIATEYMTGCYRGFWLGQRRLTTQGLDWPRAGVLIKDFRNVGYKTYGLIQFPFDKVPKEVQNACASLALRASIGKLVEDTSRPKIEETVGPIRVKYDQFASQQKVYPEIHAMIRIYLVNESSSMVKLSRC